jgi:hypothetical protein
LWALSGELLVACDLRLQLWLRHVVAVRSTLATLCLCHGYTGIAAIDDVLPVPLSTLVDLPFYSVATAPAVGGLLVTPLLLIAD